MIVDHVALELVPLLRAAILSRIDVESSFRSLNVGGWRSDESLFQWKPGTGARELAGVIAAQLDVPVRSLHGWALINRAGSRHKRHNHQSKRSGVFYVDRGSELSTPTCFELATARRATEPPGTYETVIVDQLTVAARAGRLVHFPGDMFHWVPEYKDDEPRITIAFDVR